MKQKYTRREFLKTSGAIAGAAAAGTLVGPYITKAAEATIKIGSLNHVTGLGAPWGLPMQQGFELAVEEINSKGGLLGRKIEAIYEDDNTNTDTALQKAKKLALQDKVEAMFGIIWSSIRAAIVVNVAHKYKVPFFYPTYNEGGSILANCSRYYVCTGAIPNQQLDAFLPWLADTYGPNIYFVGIDEVFTRNSWDYIEKNKILEKKGGKMLGKELTPWEVGDWSSVLRRIEAAKPDVVFPYIGGSECINFVKQFYDFGLHKKIALASNFLDETFVPAFPADLRAGIKCTASYFSSLDNPVNKAFVEKFRKKFGDKVPIANTVEANYNAVWLWKRAVEKAGKVDKEAMIDHLADQKFLAPSGEIYIQKHSNHTALHQIIAECQADGSFKIIKDFGIVEPVTECKI
jgi:urea transport system substrate-binding protein